LQVRALPGFFYWFFWGGTSGMSMSSVAETPIVGGEIWTLDETKRRLGVGNWTWLHVVRPNISPIRLGRRTYVKSDQIIQLMDTLSDEQNSMDAHNGSEING